MLENLQLWSFGTAAVLDTVLLLAMIERPNWRSVTIWMLLLALGAWLLHAGAFVQNLVEAPLGRMGPDVLWGARLTMAAGLLLMPAAMLHGLYRLSRTGMEVRTRPRRALVLPYLTLLLLWPIGASLARDPAAKFVDLLVSYKFPYLAWVSSVNILFSIELFSFRKTISRSSATQFLSWMAATVLAVTLINACLVLFAQTGYTAVILSPVVPALVFAYFVMRFQFMPLVLERTFVYGALLVGAMLLHQVVLRDLAESVREQYRIDFAIVEGIAAIALILAYQPLRQRVTEALRYLFASSSELRQENRRLSVQLAASSGKPLPELLDWFVSSVRSAFQFESAALWLIARADDVTYRAGDTQLLTDNDVRAVHRALVAASQQCATRYDPPAHCVLVALVDAKATAIVRIEHRDLAGLLLLGPKRWNQPLGDEELSALVLLVEQLGITIHNSVLQDERFAAERKLLQREKLATLGLLAGSIAHEIKNPLSSIKTIATVMAEDLGTQSPHAEDLRVILGEIDRLAATTSQLLEVARPGRGGHDACHLHEALGPTLRILGHFARQYNVELHADVTNDLSRVRADDGSLREIFFNLLSNAIEAAGTGGRVSLTCDQQEAFVVTRIHNTGPAIPAEIQAKIFEPFFTTKDSGTGLGLYVVGRRVREMGGDISCVSSAERGTTFIVHLPREGAPSRNSGSGQH